MPQVTHDFCYLSRLFHVIIYVWANCTNISTRARSSIHYRVSVPRCWVQCKRGINSFRRIYATQNIDLHRGSYSFKFDGDWLDRTQRQYCPSKKMPYRCLFCGETNNKAAHWYWWLFGLLDGPLPGWSVFPVSQWETERWSFNTSIEEFAFLSLDTMREASRGFFFLDLTLGGALQAAWTTSADGL